LFFPLLCRLLQVLTCDRSGGITRLGLHEWFKGSLSYCNYFTWCLQFITHITLWKFILLMSFKVVFSKLQILYIQYDVVTCWNPFISMDTCHISPSYIVLLHANAKTNIIWMILHESYLALNLGLSVRKRVEASKCPLLIKE
jgi:hypothetical protein